MKRKALVSAMVFAASALSCGSVDVGQVQLSVNGIQGVDRYEIRIFGAALLCSDFISAPTNFRTVNACSPANVDTSVACHIEMAIVAGGPVRMTPIPIGTRGITVIGFSSQTLSEAGCADGVQVHDGTTSVVTINMQPM